MTTPIVSDLICSALAVALSLFFGYLPLIIDKKSDAKTEKVKTFWLAFLLNFGGGVLIANSFCHWLPEVRHGLRLNTKLPVAEIVTCVGFFAICFIEELLNRLIKIDKGECEVASESTSIDRSEYEHVDKDSKDANDNDPKALIRTIFVVSALSFHSVIEGFAASLEETAAGAWINFAALASHKLVIAFSLGVELVSSKASSTNYAISIGVFSVAPALGVIIGLILDDFASSGPVEVGTQFLQGLAIGVIIYVVFFEVFPKARKIGEVAKIDGMFNVLAMISGFILFIPSLILRKSNFVSSYPMSIN